LIDERRGYNAGQGRPTKYKDEYVEIVRNLCAIGASDQQIRDYFKVSRNTILNWRRDHPEFLTANVRSRDEELRAMRPTFFECIMGYKRKVIKDFVLSHGGGSGTYIESVRRIKHFEPDVRAAIAFFQVYDPDWRAAKGDEEVDVGKLNESIEKLIGAPRKSTDDDAEKVDDQQNKSGLHP
jgi:hypothetical protein